uniref:Uncharacterized protein n=1 Tax=Salarias fasciatus TaxID=181472 RepID=A0A672F210_SALFA
MDYSAYCGRCLLFFFLAIFMDAVGFIIFLVGVAAPIKSWDFFVLSGPLLIFLSLVFWIFWYLGNLESSVGETVQNLTVNFQLKAHQISTSIHKRASF